MPEVQPDVLARQMRRYARPIVRWPGRGGFLRFWREPGFGLRKIDAQVIEAELELILVEPFGTPAEPATLQLLDDKAKPLDLGPCLGQTGALGCEAAHQRL